MLRAILIFFALICSGFAWSQPSSNAQQHLIVHPEPKPEQCDIPDWPTLTLKWEQEGIVQVAGLVDTDGKIIRSAIRHSSGYPKLDAAAETALLECSFNPGTIKITSLPQEVTYVKQSVRPLPAYINHKERNARIDPDERSKLISTHDATYLAEELIDAWGSYLSYSRQSN